METKTKIENWSTALENKNGYEPDGSLIGNNNTGKLYSPGKDGLFIPVPLVLPYNLKKYLKDYP